MKKRTVIIAVCASLVVVSVTYAYFQSRKIISLGQLSTSTLDISLESQSEQDTRTLLPGESKEVLWKLKNTGNSEVYVKGSVKAVFATSNLDPAMIRVVSIAKQDESGNWQTVSVTGANNNQFYLSQDGTDQNLISFFPLAEESYKAQIQLDENAGDEYQNVEFSTDIEMIAKQIDPNAPWPEFSE